MKPLPPLLLIASTTACSPSTSDDRPDRVVSEPAGPTAGVSPADFPQAVVEGCPELKRDNPDDDEPIGDLIRDLDERQRALFERMALADPVELVCLEDGSGVSGHGVKVNGRFDQDLWRISLSCSHWRLPDGKTDSRFLYLRNTIPIGRAKMDEQMGLIDDYAVVRLLVRLEPETANDPDAERVDGVIDAIVDPKIDDAELRAIATDRQRPKELDHPFFGPMILNRSLGRYEGSRSLGSGSYELDIDCGRNCEDPQAALPNTAEQQLRCAEASLRPVLDFATDDLLALYNDMWGGLGQQDRAGFQQRVRLESISVGEGLVSLYFQDGGLFGGHTIHSVIDTRTNEVWEAGVEG